MTQQQWFRACCRISARYGSGYAHRNAGGCDTTGAASVWFERKRAREAAAAAARTTKTTTTTTTTTTISASRNRHHTLVPSNYSLVAKRGSACNKTRADNHRGTHRGHSSVTSTSAFRKPLHRDPSIVSSAAGSIYNPPGYLLGTDRDPVVLPSDDAVVANSIRSCVKVYGDNGDNGRGGTEDDDDDDKGLYTEMSLCFLGTGAGSPCTSRSASSTLLKLAGTSCLFDAGEGTQRQLQFARGKGSSLQKIEKIFVTHMHGDHVFGLPGLLLSLQTSYQQTDENHRSNARRSSSSSNNNNKGRGKRNNNNNNNQNPTPDDDFTIKIYGSPGLFNYLASSITLSCARLHLLNVEVYELTGGRVRRVVHPPPNSGRHLPRGSPRQQHHPRDPFMDDYPEFWHNAGRIQRFRVPCKNGVWNIQDKPPPLTEEDIRSSVRRGSPRGGAILAKQQQERIRIRAAEVDHMPGVATFGFVLEEDDPPRNLDASRARAMGVSPRDKKYELLKHGFSVEADDGSGRLVKPSEVLKVSSKKARKIAFVGDNRGWTPQMAEIASKADVLVHEATLSREDRGRGHSTAAAAGQNAAKCGARLLILNHISPKMESGLSRIVEEAHDATGKTLAVLVSFDFLEVLVPWLGFGSASTTAKEASGSNAHGSSLESGDSSVQ